MGHAGWQQHRNFRGQTLGRKHALQKSVHIKKLKPQIKWGTTTTELLYYLNV